MKKVYEIEITTKAVVSVTAESEEEAFEAAWEETFKYGPDESEYKTLTCVVKDFRGLAEEIAEILTDAEVGDPCDNSGGYTKLAKHFGFDGLINPGYYNAKKHVLVTEFFRYGDTL